MCHHLFMYDGRDKNTKSQTNGRIKLFFRSGSDATVTPALFVAAGEILVHPKKIEAFLQIVFIVVTFAPYLKLPLIINMHM